MLRFGTEHSNIAIRTLGAHFVPKSEITLIFFGTASVRYSYFYL